jgi:hypothetical protein
MTKSTMTSQWDPGSYRPLDMSEIPGYPRKMPPRYEDFLPRFSGINGECPESHMIRFWKFFEYFPIDDEAEDVVMKLFSASLHEEARRWFDSLPAASITTMEQFEGIFLANWTMKIEVIQSLLKELEGIRQADSEIVKAFGFKFEKLLCQIPQSHRPEERYLVYIYTNGLQGHLGFLLSKKNPKTLSEAHNMAIQIEKNLYLTRANAMDILSLIELVSHEDAQERGEQIIEQQNEDVNEEQELEEDDEVSACAPPADEALQDPVTPAEDEENEVSCFDSFDDALFYDSENEEGTKLLDEPDPLCLKDEDVEGDLSSDDDIQILEALDQEGLSEVHCSPFQVLNGYLPYDAKSEKVLDVLTPPCYDTDTDIADFDEFIHVGRRRWDAIGYDTDPIYDTKDHLRTLPLQLPQQISFDQWQKGDEVFTCSIQNTKDDLLPLSSDVCQSYLEMFDEYAEHLNPFYENDYRPPLCSDLGTSKDIVCLKKVTHDFSSQPPVVSLPCFSIQGVVGKYLFRVEFPPRQTLDFKGWLGNNISNQFFNPLLMICQPSTKLLSILPLESEDVLGNQSTGPLCPFSEPCTFYDPFLDRIEFFPQRWTWQYFDPPTRLHELDADLSDDMMYILTHDIFVLDVSLFWFMMKHKGRYQGALLDWLHWLFDYTNMQPTGKYR